MYSRQITAAVDKGKEKAKESIIKRDLKSTSIEKKEQGTRE